MMARLGYKIGSSTLKRSEKAAMGKYHKGVKSLGESKVKNKENKRVPVTS
ncbi:hypothetical protein [Neobacillus vireti]|nr:hypothetical protein [Neobacillus vireti]